MSIRPLAVVAALLTATAALASGHGHEAKAAPSPDAVLKELMAGNARFAAGRNKMPRMGAAHRAALAKGQNPKAIVLGCSDSRVPPELVFDEGLGDLFVVRVAGNVAEPDTVGSIEYAAEHLGTPLLVVLGHLGGGAVTAAAEAGAASPEGNIGSIVKDIQPAVASVKKPGPEGLVHDAVHANARAVAAAISARSPAIAELQKEGKLKIVVGVYDLASGKVEIEP